MDSCSVCGNDIGMLLNPELKITLFTRKFSPPTGILPDGRTDERTTGLRELDIYLHSETETYRLEQTYFNVKF